MNQAQILPPDPHFIIMQNVMANLGQKIFSTIQNIEDGQKYPKKVFH